MVSDVRARRRGIAARRACLHKRRRCCRVHAKARTGRTGLRVDATRGAQDGVGCHGRDSDLSTQIAPYFADLLPLAESWRSLLGHYVHEEASVPFDEVLKVFDDFLAQMPDSEKPPAMVSTLHGLLNLAPPSPPAAKTGTKTDTTTGANIKHNTVYTKRLRDEVRSMGNPPVPTKRFKAV